MTALPKFGNAVIVFFRVRKVQHGAVLPSFQGQSFHASAVIKGDVAADKNFK
jgi:hypothetical protein